MTRVFFIKWRWVLTITTVLATQSGCVSTTRDTFAEEVGAIRESVNAPRLAEAVPPTSSVSKPQPEIAVQPAVSSLERFDISVSDTSLPVFLMGLVEDSDFNMVVHPDVSGPVRLELKRVTIPEVLDVIQQVYGVHVEVNNKLIRVLPNTMQTRVFTLDYVNLSRQGTSDMQVSTGSIKDAGSTSSSTDTTNQSQNNVASTEAVGSRVITENSVDLWQNLKVAIRSIIGDGDGRKVIVMEQAGTIVVRALQSELSAVASFLELSELSLQRQVILEAKILEVVLTDRFEQGIDWAAFGNIGGEKGGPYAFGVNGNDVNNDDGLSGVFTSVVELQDFTAIIDLLETQGKVKVLSSPRIATVNNQKAVIKVGTDEFFVTNVTSTTTTGTSTTTTPSVTLTPFFSGIALDVTPQISQDGAVILHIHPTVSQVSDQNKLVTIGDDTVNLPLALSTIRESDSIVKAQNRQVIVIGGLLSNSASNSKTGVPLFSKLPLVGRGLQQQRMDYERSELVILVRPIVMDDRRQKNEVLESLDRIQSLWGEE